MTTPIANLTAVEALQRAKDIPGSYARPEHHPHYLYFIRDGDWVCTGMDGAEFSEDISPGWTLEPWSWHPTSDTL